jgi:type III restriction enzyme
MAELKEFKELLKKLKQKTVYEISLDTSRYKEDVVAKLHLIEVREKKILKQFGSLNSELDGYVEDEKHTKLSYEEELPDIVAMLEKEIGLTRKTIIEIFEEFGFDKFTKEFVKNSDAYVKEVINSFEYVMFEMLSKDGLVYRKIDDYYEFSNIFVETIEDYNLEETRNGLYSAEQFDSSIEQEFIKCADSNFKFFTKLPRRFKIKTPLGTYNPDFAIIKHDESEGSFIIETKGSTDEKDLRGREKWQIAYAKKHFEALEINYKKKTNCRDI